MPQPKNLVRIIRDSRDAGRDLFIPAQKAKELYECGKLAWDRDNGTYCCK